MQCGPYHFTVANYAITLNKSLYGATNYIRMRRGVSDRPNTTENKHLYCNMNICGKRRLHASVTGSDLAQWHGSYQKNLCEEVELYFNRLHNKVKPAYEDISTNLNILTFHTGFRLIQVSMLISRQR